MSRVEIDSKILRSMSTVQCYSSLTSSTVLTVLVLKYRIIVIVKEMLCVVWKEQILLLSNCVVRIKVAEDDIAFIFGYNFRECSFFSKCTIGIIRRTDSKHAAHSNRV